MDDDQLRIFHHPTLAVQEQVVVNGYLSLEQPRLSTVSRPAFTSVLIQRCVYPLRFNDSDQRYSVPRVTYTQQPLTQTVTKHTRSTISPQPQGIPTPLDLRAPNTHTPQNSLTTTATTATVIIHEADTIATLLTEFMTEVRDNSIRKCIS